MQNEIRPPLSVRRPGSTLPADMPRHWLGGDALSTHFFDALSSTFPFGEAFFVRSVNAYREQIDDPVLLEAIRGFAGQESQHSHQHDEHLELLLANGYSALATRNRLIDRLLKWHNRKTPRFALAVTASLEHLTAILARRLLSRSQHWTADMPPAMARLWRWHALEEAEHKAVAFDVLMRVEPAAWLRRMAMLFNSVELSLEVAQRIVYMLYKDGLLFDRTTWSRGLRFLFGDDGFLRGLGADYRAWYRADFHPDQIDDRALIESEAPRIAHEIRT